MSTTKEKRADLRYAAIARQHGMIGSLRLLWECRAAGLPASLGLALREQETGRLGDGNVFGHDKHTIFAGGFDKLHNQHHPKVTKAAYLEYKRQRGSHGQGGMQGVGPLQLTYWSIQDEADRLGGCWKLKYNYRVGFTHLGGLIHAAHGDVRLALAIYNGGTATPNFDYADSVLKHRRFWHEALK
jgi:hypothetical protein